MKPIRQRTGALCMQHSSTAAALSTSFLLCHAPKKAPSKRIDYKIYGVIQQRQYESWVKRLKKLSSDWLNSGNALIQRVKNAIFVFSVLPGNAESQVTW